MGETPTRVIGRYALYDEIGAGGMATVHFGRLIGPAGFSKTVAIKRLHPQFARDPEFASMFLDEARLAARIQHPNVVATIDVVAKDGELFLVMEFIEGLSLAGLFWAAAGSGQRIPLGVIGAVMTNVLAGLHAAHEARSERGDPLNLIHRDVSPQNVLVGRDGVARVLDFGIAKAVGRSHTTREGRIKGKFAYMPPEQLRGKDLDRRVDIYAASVMLWELLAMRRLYEEGDDAAVVYRAMSEEVPKPSTIVPDLPPGADELVLRGVSKDRDQRFATARDMAKEVQRVFGAETAMEVGDYVSRAGKDTLFKIASKVRSIESSSSLAPPKNTDPSTGAETIPVLPALFSAGGPEALPDGGVIPGGAATALLGAPGPAPTGNSGADYFNNLDLDLSPRKPTPPTEVSARAPVPALAPENATLRDEVPSRTGALVVDLEMPGTSHSNARPAPFQPHPAAQGRGSSAGPVVARSHVPSVPPPRAFPTAFIGALGVTALGVAAVALYLHYGKAPETNTKSVVTGAPPGGLERSCEVGRKRILTGGEGSGPFDTYGWAVELWLVRDGGPALDPTTPAVASLRGSDGLLAGNYDLQLATGERGEVSVSTLSSPPTHTGTEPGVVVDFSGAYADKFFSENTRGAFFSLADLVYRKSGATMGALYAKCAHLPYHDVGGWFRGTDLAAVADAIGFSFSAYTETPWISRADFEPRGHATNSFEAYQQRRLGIDSDALTEQLKLLGASVTDEKGAGATVIFTAANPTRAISASRWITQRAGLQ